MQQGPFTVSIARGEGLVVHFGDVVMYIADSSAAASPLIAAVESVADERYPGAAIAGQIATIAFEHGAARAFGVVAPTADGLLVLLRGDVTAEVDAPGGAHVLTGARALTWVDEVVPTGEEPIAVRMGTATGVVGSPLTDLHAGVVPGGGFVLEHAGVVASAEAVPKAVVPETMMRMKPAAARTPPADTRVSHAVSRDDTAMSQAVSPTDTRVSQAVSPSDTRVAHAVQAGNAGATQASPAIGAVLPPRGRSEAATAAAGPAVLVTEDGATYPLDRAYVIGRDPHGDPSVRNATASPIVVQHDRHISRVHAYISVEDDKVYVRDAITPGGTYISAPGAHEWTQIGTTPTELKPGWSIEVGNQILTYRPGRLR